MRMREWEREGGIFNSFLHTINQRGNILSHLTPFIYTPQSKEEREGKREREKKRERKREREVEREKKKSYTLHSIHASTTNLPYVPNT